MKIAYKTIKSYYNYNKILKVKNVMYILNKSTRLHQVVMMIKDHKVLIKLQHIHMEKMHLKYAKVRC